MVAPPMPEEIRTPPAGPETARPVEPLPRWTRLPSWLRKPAIWSIRVFTVLAMAWAFGAIWFDLPGGAVSAFLWLTAAIGTRFALRKWRRRALVWPAFFLLVWLPWVLIRPSNDRDWAPEYARAAKATVSGDLVTINNVRNFDYEKGPDGKIIQIPRWETRTYRLSELRGLDMFINYWGSPWMAHPILSFDFGPDGRLAFSIETRREATEGYSALAGLYKVYELTYIAADERDVIRVRTNFRENEDVYLYRLRTPPDKAKERFLEYVARINELHERAQFYDVLMANCTTSIRAQMSAANHLPWDWRYLLNGKMDKMLWMRGAFRHPEGMDFPELRNQAHINPEAQAAGNADDFSERIRSGRAGFQSEP
jgi:hypothetical protein